MIPLFPYNLYLLSDSLIPVGIRTDYLPKRNIQQVKGLLLSCCRQNPACIFGGLRSQPVSLSKRLFIGFAPSGDPGIYSSTFAPKQKALLINGSDWLLSTLKKPKGKYQAPSQHELLKTLFQLGVCSTIRAGIAAHVRSIQLLRQDTPSKPPSRSKLPPKSAGPGLLGLSELPLARSFLVSGFRGMCRMAFIGEQHCFFPKGRT